MARIDKYVEIECKLAVFEEEKVYQYSQRTIKQERIT